ncbi:large ribosomal subunit protein eL27-like [Curcuma longa]|uniref:large ribosomal subunit protein eL27-like n=1 Tax=Curcuma longa TaxID=136217 RepID=UPI003D9DD8E3
MVKILKPNKAVILLEVRKKGLVEEDRQEVAREALSQAGELQPRRAHRCTLDVDHKDVAATVIDAFQTRDRKVAASKEAKARLEERSKTGKQPLVILIKFLF